METHENVEIVCVKIEKPWENVWERDWNAINLSEKIVPLYNIMDFVGSNVGERMKTAAV